MPLSLDFVVAGPPTLTLPPPRAPGQRWHIESPAAAARVVGAGVDVTLEPGQPLDLEARMLSRGRRGRPAKFAWTRV